VARHPRDSGHRALAPVPAQPRLGGLEDEELKEPPIAMMWEPPLNDRSCNVWVGLSQGAGTTVMADGTMAPRIGGRVQAGAVPGDCLLRFNLHLPGRDCWSELPSTVRRPSSRRGAVRFRIRASPHP